MNRRFVILCFMFLAALSVEANAQDLRRCQRADGSVIYTDRQCESGQGEMATQIPNNAPAKPGVRAMAPPPACSQTANDLLYNVRIAIDSHDVNLLARSYHWPGLGDAQVESVLNRMDALVQRPLVDIRLLYPESTVNPEKLITDADIASDDLKSNPDAEYSAVNHTPTPYGLKLQQYASSTSSEILATRFGLQRHFNCWWIRY
jgi:hypothetical protein